MIIVTVLTQLFLDYCFAFLDLFIRKKMTAHVLRSPFESFEMIVEMIAHVLLSPFESFEMVFNSHIC